MTSSFSLPRRRLLVGGAAALAGAATLSPSLVLASAPGGNQRLVLFVLRGAMDGLGAVVPLQDPAYKQLRTDIALDQGLPLDGFFSLHPAMAPIHGWYKEGTLLPVHAVASPYRERSHFDGQDVLELGLNAKGLTREGWLSRTLVTMASEGPGDKAISVGIGVPLVLRGKAKVLSWAPSSMQAPTDSLMDRAARLYQADDQLHAAFDGAVQAQAMAGGFDDAELRNRELKTLAEAAGRFLTAQGGPRIAVISNDGWDTHVGQGGETGRLAKQLEGLSNAFVALRTSLREEAWKNTVVLAVTEFGRTAAVNGTGGTDHGTASAAFVAGGAVKGGRVLTDWPGLGEAALYEDRDLAPTRDVRALFKAALGDHLKISSRGIEEKIFPDAGSVKAESGLFI